MERPRLAEEHGTLVQAMVFAGLGFVPLAASNAPLLSSLLVYRPLLTGVGAQYVSHVMVRRDAAVRARPLVGGLLLEDRPLVPYLPDFGT